MTSLFLQWIISIKIFCKVNKATGKNNQVTWKPKRTLNVVVLHLFHQVKSLRKFNIFF